MSANQVLAYFIGGAPTVSKVECQYSYFVEDGQQITDPTVPERVQDDFGGENSVITINPGIQD